jgi:hypothetical protein
MSRYGSQADFICITVTAQPRNMSLRGALGFAEAVSQYREIASLRQAQDRRRDPEKTSGQASKSPPRNDMPERLRIFVKSSLSYAPVVVKEHRLRVIWIETC